MADEEIRQRLAGRRRRYSEADPGQINPNLLANLPGRIHTGANITHTDQALAAIANVTNRFGATYNRLSARVRNIIENPGLYTLSQVKSALLSARKQYFKLVNGGAPSRTRKPLDYIDWRERYDDYVRGGGLNVNDYIEPFRGVTRRKAKTVDPYWFWDYSKIKTTARDPGLRLTRQGSDNVRYKQFLKANMIRAAKEWMTLHPGSVIAHGYY